MNEDSGLTLTLVVETLRAGLVYPVTEPPPPAPWRSLSVTWCTPLKQKSKIIFKFDP